MCPLCGRLLHSGHNQGYRSERHSLRLHMLRGNRMFDLQKEIKGHISLKTGEPVRVRLFLYALRTALSSVYHRQQNICDPVGIMTHDFV